MAGSGSNIFSTLDPAERRESSEEVITSLRKMFSNSEVFETKEALEIAAAGLAAERATAAQTASMAQELEGMSASLDEPELYLRHDRRFHEIICAASCNHILTALLDFLAIPLGESEKTVQRVDAQRTQELRESLEVHNQIYSAVRTGDAEAARNAMRDHLARSRRAHETRWREPATGAHPEITLSALQTEFDALLARMQKPKARAGMKSAFNASPTKLGKAAVEAARKRDRGI